MSDKKANLSLFLEGVTLGGGAYFRYFTVYQQFESIIGQAKSIFVLSSLKIFLEPGMSTKSYVTLGRGRVSNDNTRGAGVGRC